MDYLRGSVSKGIGAAGLTNPYSLPLEGGAGSGSGAGGANCCCPSSTKFLETLTDKLIAMTQSLKQQFKDCMATPSANKGRGIILVNIEVNAKVRFKYEYVLYVQRYGPPVNGIFDPVYLDLIRAEIAAGTV